MTTNPSALDAVTSHSPASSPELPKLPEPWTAASTLKCTACGAPYEPVRALAPMGGAACLSGYVPAHACKCGNTQFGGTFGYDSPSPAQFTATQMNAHYLKGYEAGSAAAAQAVPEGFVLVPREPTNEMYLAACRAFTDWSCQCDLERDGEAPFTKGTFNHCDTYRAMLAAAPTQGAEGAAPQAAPEAGERTCSTCRHIALLENGACAGCGYAAPYDRWEAATPASPPAPAPQAVVGEASEQSTFLSVAQTVMQRLHNNACAARYLPGNRIVVRFDAVVDAIQEIVAVRRTPSPTPTAPQDKSKEQWLAETAQTLSQLDAKAQARRERMGLGQQEADALREDAERYRHLRQQAMFGDYGCPPGPHWWLPVFPDTETSGRTFDDVVDASRAALAQHQPQQGEQRG